MNPGYSPKATAGYAKYLAGVRQAKQKAAQSLEEKKIGTQWHMDTTTANNAQKAAHDQTLIAVAASHDKNAMARTVYRAAQVANNAIAKNAAAFAVQMMKNGMDT